MKAQPKKKELPQQPLTIFLLKEGVTEPEQFLKSAASLSRSDVNLPAFEGLYVRESVPVPVKWAKFFSGIVADLDLESQSVGAVLHVRAAGRDFALTFGYGRSLLEPGSYVEDFGFRVTLNTVDPTKIRSITRSSFDAISSRGRIQAGEPAEITDFGMNPASDLLRAIEGKPSDESLACKIAGADALKVWARVKPDGVASLLEAYLQRYTQATPERFAWLNNLRPISDKTTIQTLEQRLLETIQDPSQRSVWLLEPQVLETFDLDGFSFSTEHGKAPDPYLRVERLRRALPSGKPVTLELLKKTKVLVHSSVTGESQEQWPVFACLHAQFDDGDHVNVLSEGSWYRVAASLQAEVKTFYATVPKRDDLLPPYVGGSEASYNAAAAKQLGWELRDKLLSTVEKVEFCDLYATDEKLIVHVKRHARSSVLSHLFMQGLNSGRMLKREARFREWALKEHLNELDASQYTVVFAITSDSTGALDIPFFSKLTLKNVHTELREMGFNVLLVKIEDQHSKTKHATAA